MASVKQPGAAEIRAWAKDNNIDVPPRGRVPADLVMRYLRTTSEPEPEPEPEPAPEPERAPARTPSPDPCRINVDPTLLQGIRTYHAIAEAGVKLSVERAHRSLFDYLNGFFDLSNISYRLPGPTEVPLADVKINHAKPTVQVGPHTVPLLYARETFNRCRSMWNEARPVSFFFSGLTRGDRDGNLELWRGDPDALIVSTDRGRKQPTKSWEDDYFITMAAAQFALCPAGTDAKSNGEYVWTYRFFDAVMCGAVPIVFAPAPCYEGFHYVQVRDWRDAEWDPGLAQQNFELAVSRWTLGADQILEGVQG